MLPLFSVEHFLTLKLPEVINMWLLPIVSSIIQQTGSEKTQTYQAQDIILIEHQILVTNLQQDV